MRILLVEDEIKTLLSLRQGMEEQGWTVNTATDGEAGLRLASNGDYDVIISDITMPVLSGLDLCSQLREAGIRTPLLLLTALSDTDDKVIGLEAGADDYLSKPFEFKELLARVKALARRPATAVRKENMLRYADLEIDLDMKQVSRSGRDISLTPREFALLEFFMRNPEKVLSKIDKGKAGVGILTGAALTGAVTSGSRLSSSSKSATPPAKSLSETFNVAFKVAADSSECSSLDSAIARERELKVAGT